MSFAHTTWRTLLSELCVAVTCACAHGASPTVPAVDVPGIPNRSDLVTVVPFANDPDSSSVIIPAEIDGHQGVFYLDTGNPGVILNAFVLHPNATGGVDTVRGSQVTPWPGVTPVHIHHVRLGTLYLTDFEAPRYLETDQPSRPVNAIVMRGVYARYMLGNLGLAVLEPFETIIDYPRRRVVLIRLDQVGHRLVPVPAYRPTWSAPLIEVGERSTPNQPEPWHWWGVQAQVGGITGSWILDTETSEMSLINGAVYPEQVRHLPPHGTGRLRDALVIAGRRFDLGDSVSNDAGYYGNILGGPFLRQLGVVGFNHRAHQFLLYREE